MPRSRHLLLAGALACAVGLSVAGAEENATNPGSNTGSQVLAPSQPSGIRAIPTPEEAQAALREPVSIQPSAGGQQASGGKPPPGLTTGSSGAGNANTTVSNEPPPSGPIGAIGQTMPAKFSKRNDILDRAPIMAFPLDLSDQQRQQIYQAVMSDKAAPAPNAESLMPSSELSTEQALDGMHPLPDSLRGIEQVQRLKFVKAKDKVLLVQPSTRTVVDQIKG